ncbi:unnamed protein product [Rhizophagus irregularis]|uniref:Uncharacterized protein n=1 Tax=Rhizophagus irregularis TaxID=588596 RepID=A0A916EBL7_9GLOM|nr:unnamed protein product [Rhizophagus irregularis]
MSKGKQILRNNAHTTTDNKENADDNGNIKGRKCEKCKQVSSLGFFRFLYLIGWMVTLWFIRSGWIFLFIQ